MKKPFTQLTKRKKIESTSFTYSYSPYKSSTSSFSSPLRYNKNLNMMAATRSYLDDGLNKPLNFDYSEPYVHNSSSKVNSSPF